MSIKYSKIRHDPIFKLRHYLTVNLFDKIA